MAFSEDGTSLGTVANAGQGGDFDWYDGGSDFVGGGNDMFDYDRSGATPDGVSPVSPDFTDPNNVPEIEIVVDEPQYQSPDDIVKLLFRSNSPSIYLFAPFVAFSAPLYCDFMMI